MEQDILDAHTGSAKLAVFCDFENIAIGVRESHYEEFDVKKVVERLLLKGGIFVKKAYCDWEHYAEFKIAMHEAAFELIEIPRRRWSGKNSADIRMVVDALDLCYTKPHLDTFVILSGDSDFSPLVSKLRENDKLVIGVGLRNSTSDLLTANCDEFIFYDDLVRRREKRKRGPKQKSSQKKEKLKGENKQEEKEEKGLQDALDLIVETIDMLIDERGEEETIWGSMVKQAIKRRKPGFDESCFGFRTFSQLLEKAQEQELVELELDKRSGGYIVKAVYLEE